MSRYRTKIVDITARQYDGDWQSMQDWCRDMEQLNTRLRELGEAARKVSRKFDYLNRLIEGNPTP